MSDERSGVWLAIAVGGALGALGRFALAKAIARTSRAGSAPIDAGHATWLANTLACFLLGALTAFAAASPLALTPTPAEPPPSHAVHFPTLSALGATGFCGSLSTFSTLCADLVRVARAGHHGRLAVFALAHLAGGPAAFAAGLVAAG